MTDRQQVVAVARSWVDTPFHHQARLKHVGVDCIGLVIGIARELALVAPDFDVQGYAETPDGRTLMRLATLHMVEIDREAMAPGDIVVTRFDQGAQHFGILGDYRHGGLSIIHGASDPGRVIETRLMFGPFMQFVAAFALPGLV
jgi:NlpC/P60 family putative phage cell wall peptidase